MITVHKYPLLQAAEQDVELPEGAELLTVQVQHEYTPTLWARVDTERPAVRRRIHLVGTGHDAPVEARYLGTVQLYGGTLVLHAFAE